MSTPVLHHHPAHKELLPVQGPGRGTDRRAKPVAAESADPTAAGGLAAQTADRRAKRDALAARGINPYPTRFERSATLAELHSAYAELEPDTRTGDVAKVAGRVVSMRGHGKLRFVTIEDTNSSVQLMFQADHLAEDTTAVEALVDLGDWVGVTGEVITSRRGELSVDVSGLEILAKALRPLPDRWYGLNEAETRYRQREVDLLANKESRRVFDIRFKTLSILRERLTAQAFVEVETPILQPQAGGALARPFFTHANALDAEFSLRIAPELYLKRLVVGGYERVFEIARNFRNEGIDTRHSPEFTALEAYRAFGDFRDGMDLTEHLIAEAAHGAAGRFEFDFAGQHVDLQPPWPRRDLLDMLEERLGRRVHPSMPVADVRAICEAHGVPYVPAWGSGKLIFELYDKILMPETVGPVFIYHYPTEVSPLARQSVEDPTVTDRFELVITGRELANGYSELNDPDEQARRFEAEAAAAGGGDVEAHPSDTAFVRALEFGLPPTSGIGIGVDRLVMLLAEVPAIRDVILFPLMRAEAGS
jgi:lysyl-tRNA synthetase class 2